MVSPSEETSLLDVFEAIEGPLEACDCLLESRVCGGSQCLLGELIVAVNKQVRDCLSGRKLSDLAM